MSETTIESVEEFRARARAWISANLPPALPNESRGLTVSNMTQEEELASVTRDRELQRMLFDAGLAGVCVPTAYGGQGLTPAHQKALNEELDGHETPIRIQVPTFSPCMAVILEFGTEEQKQAFVPPILKGEAIWMQLLSEPSGGSDVAAALTSAVRDGEEWVLNGSKVWTTGAWWSDWGLCLARTNWDVPKHRGLTVFVFPLKMDGVEVQQIEMLNGSKEFCQEFLTDVRIPDFQRIGEVDDGWTVGTRWMFHERMQFNSPLVTVAGGVGHSRRGGSSVLRDVARDAGRLTDPVARDLLGEARTLEVVGGELAKRIGQGIATGTLPEQISAAGRIMHGVSQTRMLTIGFQLAGGLGGAWGEADGAARSSGTEFLMRQTSQIGGGTTEMARNVLSERVLGMPRERTNDKDVAFRTVPRGPSAHG